MKIRKYSKADAKALLALYYYTVHATNIRDYSPEQINAWVPTATEGLGAWNDRLLYEKTVVAESGESIIGFGTLHDQGKSIGMLYVNPEYQGKGYGKALLKKLEKRIKKKGGLKAVAEVSLTAREFFESQGYHWVRDNRKMLNGEEFLNFIMEKDLLQKKNKSKKDKKDDKKPKSLLDTLTKRIKRFLSGSERKKHN